MLGGAEPVGVDLVPRDGTDLGAMDAPTVDGEHDGRGGDLGDHVVEVQGRRHVPHRLEDAPAGRPRAEHHQPDPQHGVAAPDQMDRLEGVLVMVVSDVVGFVVGDGAPPLLVAATSLRRRSADSGGCSKDPPARVLQCRAVMCPS